MKKISFILMAALLMLGLAQCTKPATPEEELVSITLKIVDNAKVGIDPENSGAMTFNDQDDIIVAYNGRYVGKLHYYKGYFVNSSLAITPSDTPKKLHFYFLGNRGTLSSGNTSCTFSIADQSESYPVLAYGASNEYFNGAGTYSAHVSNYCGLVKFNLESDIPADVPVTVSGMSNQVTVHFDYADDANPFTTSMADGGGIILHAESAQGRWAILPLQEDPVDDAMASAAGYGTSEAFTVPSVTQNMYYTDGVIVPELVAPSGHSFSINADGTKVFFAPGNLQWQNGTWSFAANEWDYYEIWGGNNPRDQFGWGTWTGSSPNPNLSTNTASNYSFDPSDFQGQIDGYDYTWRTLAKEEWAYLINDAYYNYSNRRQVMVNGEAKVPFGNGTVMGVNGLILLPDDWDGSVDGSFTYGESNYGTNNYTEETSVNWSDMKEAGAVFLPAAGYHTYSGSTTNYSYFGIYGYYWSKTNSNSSSSNCLHFRSNYVRPESANSKYNKYSVRLVRSAD